MQQNMESKLTPDIVNPQDPPVNRSQATPKLPSLDMGHGGESHWQRGRPSHPSLPGRPEETHGPETLAKNQLLTS